MKTMEQPIIVSGKEFTAPFLESLQSILDTRQDITKAELLRIICEHLGWFTSNGQLAVASAKVALVTLLAKGLLSGAQLASSAGRPRRLARSGKPLPPLLGVPRRVDLVSGLSLYLVDGSKDPLSCVWNDLIIDQHPCGDAPLVGAQLRYLIGSSHGWLGAVGFGSASFVLGDRDRWIGWSTAARVGNLQRVVGLSRLLIRTEVRCKNLASKVLGMAVERVRTDWMDRYAIEPLLVETFVDRDHFTGRCFAAANWRRIGCSTGRGRLGTQEGSLSTKDIWVHAVHKNSRPKLCEEKMEPIEPLPLLECLNRPDWFSGELGSLELGDKRLNTRAQAVLRARWNHPQSTFHSSFEGWTQAKGAYGLINHPNPLISLQTLIEPHIHATMGRMAAEPVVLLPQDTTSLNYSGLKETSGLGPLGKSSGQGLWLHSLLAFRPDGIPLGILDVQCKARDQVDADETRRRNAKAINRKESVKWLKSLERTRQFAPAMPQTKLVALADREGDLFELHDMINMAPPNLHNLVRAKHDRNLENHQKLWSFMAEQPVGATGSVKIPRRKGKNSRIAQVQIRWSPVLIHPPQTGHKKSWPPLALNALWVEEANPPEGEDAIEWMLLSDLPIRNESEAQEMIQWYRCRWGIEEWHRVLKSGCWIEKREFKTAEHLKRAAAFDLIIGWRILACVKAGRTLPQLDALCFYAQDELDALWTALKKKPPRKTQR
jgi:hypothetical protein